MHKANLLKKKKSEKRLFWFQTFSILNMLLKLLLKTCLNSEREQVGKKEGSMMASILRK